MELVKIVILEDEKEHSDKLISFLNQYSQETGKVSFDIRLYEAPLEFMETFRYDADIIFLDIQMPGMTGMDVAHEIRKQDQDVTLIFITALTQYAVEGYSVQAEDYILKPISYPEFKMKMVRSLSRIVLKGGKYLTFINNETIQKVSLDSITYIETDMHRLLFHDNEGFCFVKHQSMKELEEELKGTDFLRINSSYLVNLRYAVNISNGDMLLNDGTRLKISRPRMSEVCSEFAQFKK